MSKVVSKVETQSSVPLVVDLDGTLVKTDLLIESLLVLLKHNLLYLFLLPFWLLRGKAYFKHQVAVRADMDPALLPYDRVFLEFLKQEYQEGRELILATASDETLAAKVANHIGLFREVIASDGITNRAGAGKLHAIQQLCGDSGFAYAGNAPVDKEIWRQARSAILVNCTKQTERLAKNAGNVQHVFGEGRFNAGAYLRAMRIYQWSKNLLVFIPIIVDHSWHSGLLVWNSVLACVAFCLAASAAYILNDLLDLAADRSHIRKRERPIAAGTIPLGNAGVLFALLAAGALVVGLGVSTLFVLVLSTYFALTIAYSVHLKSRPIVDVLVLASLYTLRVVGGAAAIYVMPSFWLLAFSMFIFVSLALIKRIAELNTMRQMDRKSAKGRGYQTKDLPYLYNQGTASGFMAVLVLALFVNSPDVAHAYTHPKALWFICPVLLYWLSRMWLKTGRGQMHDDPIVFAAMDRGSQLAGVVTAIIFVISL